MNIVLIVVIVIVAIIALVLVTAVFTKRDYTVDRQITIDKPAPQVFGYIRYLKNIDKYNKWAMMDPAMRKDFRGEDGTEGFTYAWDGDKKAGAGEQTITRIDNGKRIESQIRFVRPFVAIADSYMEVEPVTGGSTLVKWGFASKMPYPMNAMLIFMDMGEMLGKDLNISLENLKRILEAQS